MLLRGISDVAYVKPNPLEDNIVGKRSVPAPTRNVSTDSPWKPRKHAGNNLYSPRTKNEEIILLLLLSENNARKEAILSQAPEFFGMRSTKFRDAIITYDLMTIALSRIRNFKLLSDMLEHSMKFSFNEPHTWNQLGLALAAEGHYQRSLNVFREIAERNQADAGVCLAVAKMCFEMLHLYDEGIAWAKRALKKDSTSQDRFLRARCNIFLGIGHMLKAKTLDNHTERQDLHSATEHFFTEAHKADPLDHLTEFYLAFFYAQTRETVKATRHVRKSLDFNPEHLPSLHLMILLLTAKDEYEEALEITDLALDEYPDNLSIMSLKVRLEEKVNGGEAGVLTAKGESIHFSS